MIIFLLPLILSAGLCSEALACRYNVRETGFVDFGIRSYRLFYFIDSQNRDPEPALLKAVAQEVFRDNSIALEIVSIEDHPDHPALGDWSSAEAPSPPFAVLVSPLGHARFLGHLWDEEYSPEQVRASLTEIVSSPIRSKIAHELASAFAVILLMEGVNETENARARTSVLQAIGTLESELEYFPKPIKKGPVLVTLARADLASEQQLLWSFDLDPDDLQQPVVAILYGRGRWIGPLMIGEEITFDLVTRILFIVGADCECDLDPRLLRGTAIPIPWSSRLQELVSRDLGFDPDNPLVRMEISQILKINNWDRSSTKRTSQLPLETDPAGESSDGLFSIGFLSVVGGIAVLVIIIGGFILIRAARKNEEGP